MLLVASTRASTSSLRYYSVASKARKGRPAAAPNAPSASAPRPPPCTTHTAPLSASPSPLYSHPAAIATAGTTPGTSTLVQQGKGKGKALPDDAWRESLHKGSWAEPPLVAKARGKTVKQRNVWESYLVLPAKTRLYFSLGLFAVGLIGLYGGDFLVPDTAEELAIKEGDVLPVLVSTGAGAGEVGGSGRV